MADTNLSKANKPSFGTRVKRFFKDTKAELKKVTWPDKEQLIHNTGVIIVFILIITIILSVLDFGFAKLFQLLTNILSFIKRIVREGERLWQKKQNGMWHTHIRVMKTR